jgi:hypothetical protein
MTPGDPSQLLLKAWIECRDAECEGRGVNFGHFYVDDARAVLAELEALRVVADATEAHLAAIEHEFDFPTHDNAQVVLACHQRCKAALDHYKQARSTETK